MQGGCPAAIIAHSRKVSHRGEAAGGWVPASELARCGQAMVAVGTSVPQRGPGTLCSHPSGFRQPGCRCRQPQASRSGLPSPSFWRRVGQLIFLLSSCSAPQICIPSYNSSILQLFSLHHCVYTWLPFLKSFLGSAIGVSPSVFPRTVFPWPQPWPGRRMVKLSMSLLTM